MQPPARNGRNLRAYRRRASRVSKGAVCYLCGQPIDRSLPRNHAMAGTADHLDPIGKGGKILGPMMPAHRKCNAARGVGNNDHRASAGDTGWQW